MSLARPPRPQITTDGLRVYVNAYYNFARYHSTIRCSPAMAAGVTPHLWSIAEMVALLPAPVAKKRGPHKPRNS